MAKKSTTRIAACEPNSAEDIGRSNAGMALNNDTRSFACFGDAVAAYLQNARDTAIAYGVSEIATVTAFCAAVASGHNYWSAE